MENLIKQFNIYARNNISNLQKALTSATGVGEALIPENLEQLITDTLIRLSPELAMAESKKISGKIHEFNRLIERPGRGGAMGENATTGVTNSKTARDSVELKVVRRKGKVTNFLLDTSEEYIDSAAYEMEQHLQAHVLDLIYYILYGNSEANQYEYAGLDFYISTNRINKAKEGVVPEDLTFLDALIDQSNRKGGARHRRAFGMSPEMLSKVSSLLTNVRLNQGLTGGGLTQVDIGGGWRLNAYRDIPIIETTATRPIEQMSPTITLATESTGGGLSDATYYVQIAPITYEGEQLASDEDSIVLSGGGAAQRIKISFDTPHKSGTIESALAYKIYVSTTTDEAKLVKIVPAFTYDAEGTIDGDNGIDPNFIYVDSLTPGNDVPSHMQNDEPLVLSAAGAQPPEVIYLWDLDPIQGLGKLPFTNRAGDKFEGLVTTKPLAETDDFIQFLVKSYTALTPAFEATSAWVRGWKTA
jgi:hypothetical protein